MKKNNIKFSQTNSGHCEMTVSGETDAQEMFGALLTLTRSESTKIEVKASGDSVSDFMLLQFVALLKKEGKDISLCWTDGRKPFLPLNTLLGS